MSATPDQPFVPRPIELTDELKAQLNSVATATLTAGNQERSITVRMRHAR